MPNPTEPHPYESKLRPGTTIKPPLGLIPKWLHDEHRLTEILDAMARYRAAGMPVPAAWRTEHDALAAAAQARAVATG